MSQLIDRIEEELIQAIDDDALILPTLPEVAIRVRDAAENPDIGTQALSRVISNDAALAARLIKVVNSPLLRGNREINDLQSAIDRLGINYTCSLAIGLAMEQMFQATNEAVDQALRQVWTNSTEIAAISQVLCRHFTRLQPDQATLAGLVHQIGVLPILAYVEERELTLVDAASLAHVSERLHPRLGERILRAWDFPEAIVMVPAQMGDFTRDSPSVDYVDVVQVAILQSLLGTRHPLTELDWASVPAFAKLGFDPKADIQSDEDVQGALRVAMSMLQ